MIVTSFLDLKLCGKQISQSFSDCELINYPKNGTKVHCLKPLLETQLCISFANHAFFSGNYEFFNTFKFSQNLTF